MKQANVNGAGKVVTRDQLDLIPVPAETDTYKPVSHYDFVHKILIVSQDLLTLTAGDSKFQLDSEHYKIAREGMQMFGMICFKNDHHEIKLALAFRNSLDKSMSLGIACGAVVNICTNLCISGEITYMRKHTLNVWADINEKLITNVYKSRHNYHQITATAGKLEQITFGNEEAFAMMGRLYGNDIVSPRQLTALKDEWLKPSYDEFKPRNAWSFYNATTEALKTSPPSEIMERHATLTKYFNNVIQYPTNTVNDYYTAERAEDLVIEI